MEVFVLTFKYGCALGRKGRKKKKDCFPPTFIIIKKVRTSSLLENDPLFIGKRNKNLNTHKFQRDAYSPNSAPTLFHFKKYLIKHQRFYTYFCISKNNHS